MDLNNIPDIEDKIYDIFADLLSIKDLERIEVKEIVDAALKLNNMTMDILISHIIDGIDNGVSMEDQFKIIKNMLK